MISESVKTEESGGDRNVLNKRETMSLGWRRRSRGDGIRDRRGWLERIS